MTIQNKTIVIFNQEQYEKEWPEENAIEFIKWFSDKVNTIPSEYRNKARIELESITSYESSSYVHIEISYVRPETPEEEKSRMDNNDYNNKAHEKRERNQLSILKAKYEGGK